MQFLEMDKYNCVITTNDNIKQIAKTVYSQHQIFTWEDDSNCYTIILNYKPTKPLFNPLTQGLKQNYLYVSIISMGSFGFKINDNSISKKYYEEKLRGNLPDKLIELLEGIRKELFYLENKKAGD